MKTPFRTSLYAVFAFFIVLSPVIHAQTYDPLPDSKGKFHTCKPSGKGSDPYLNELKNRDIGPSQFTIETVANVLATYPQLPGKKGSKRSTWKATDTKTAASKENHGVVIEGFLWDIHPEGAEACNCGSTKFHDCHLWLTEKKGEDRTQAMVAEISPRELPNHPGWTVSAIHKMAKNKTKVRISGWLTWDQEHPEQIGQFRATLWEIHPIHKIEFMENGTWKEL